MKLKTNVEKLVIQIESTNELSDKLNEICELIEKAFKATGVYIYNYDWKKQLVDELSYENAHLLDYKVYQVVATSNSHKDFLHKILEQGEGVINQIKNNDINYLFLDDVLKNENVKFFKNKNNGSLLALDMTYQTSLNKNSLNSSIKNYNDYICELKEYEDYTNYLKNSLQFESDTYRHDG